MKVKYLCFIIIILSVVFISCGDSKKKKGSPAEFAKEVAENVKSDSVLRKKVAFLGKQVSARLVQTLSGELKAALAKSDIAGAVEVCKLKAMPITDTVSVFYGLEINRKTDKPRNPENAADKRDLEIMMNFNQSVLANQYHLHRTKENDESVYYYYQPLYMQDLCLNCHGDKSLFTDNLLAILHREYPDDKAFAYKKGDLRGIIKVRIPDSKIK